jgi:hypothetical protein
MLPKQLRRLEKATGENAYPVFLSAKLKTLQDNMVTDVNERVSAAILAQKMKV